MRKNISLAFLLLALIAVLTLLLDHRITPQIRTIDDISKSAYQPVHDAPDFSFIDIKGRKSSLEAQKGKIVILHFWATWCPPCVTEFPKLVSVSSQFRDDIILVAVSSDSNSADIQKFINRTATKVLGMDNIYMVWDKNRAITHDLYQTFAYPETIITSRDGRMLRKIPGDADWTSPEMKTYLQNVIGTLADGTVKP